MDPLRHPDLIEISRRLRLQLSQVLEAEQEAAAITLRRRSTIRDRLLDAEDRNESVLITCVDGGTDPEPLAPSAWIMWCWRQAARPLTLPCCTSSPSGPPTHDQDPGRHGSLGPRVGVDLRTPGPGNQSGETRCSRLSTCRPRQAYRRARRDCGGSRDRLGHSHGDQRAGEVAGWACWVCIHQTIDRPIDLLTLGGADEVFPDSTPPERLLQIVRTMQRPAAGPG